MLCLSFSPSQYSVRNIFIWFVFSLQIWCHFTHSFLSVLIVLSSQKSDYSVSWCRVLEFPIWHLLTFLNLLVHIFYQILDTFNHYFFGRNDAKAETPVLWPPHTKSWLIGQDSDAGRDWGQEEKRTTEDEMARWHHWLNGCEFEWTPGVGDGQRDLECCDSWGRKESDTTERLNWTELIYFFND